MCVDEDTTSHQNGKWDQICKMNKTDRSSHIAGVMAVSNSEVVTEMNQVLSWITEIFAFLYPEWESWSTVSGKTHLIPRDVDHHKTNLAVFRIIGGGSTHYSLVTAVKNWASS